MFGELERRLTQRLPEETTATALRAWIGWLLQEIEDTDHDELRRRREVVESDPALRTFERGLQERAERTIAAAAAVDLGLDANDLLPHMVAAATIAALDALGTVMKSTPQADFREVGLALADRAMVFVGGGVEALAADVRSPGP